jgi:DNA-binding MarR family transcriptional regulator
MTDSETRGETRGEAVDELNRAVSLLLRRAKRFTSERARELDPCLPGPGYNLLVLLGHLGPRRAQSLADLYELDKGVVSRYVQQLTDLGLVTRTADPTDRRATLLELSEEGRRRLEESLARRRTEVADTLLADWSPQRVRRLAHELAAYTEALERRP